MSRVPKKTVFQNLSLASNGIIFHQPTPQKSNMDTKKCHEEKGVTGFPNHHFGYPAVRAFGGVTLWYTIHAWIQIHLWSCQRGRKRLNDPLFLCRCVGLFLFFFRTADLTSPFLRMPLMAFFLRINDQWLVTIAILYVYNYITYIDSPQLIQKIVVEVD